MLVFGALTMIDFLLTMALIRSCTALGSAHYLTVTGVMVANQNVLVFVFYYVFIKISQQKTFKTSASSSFCCSLRHGLIDCSTLYDQYIIDYIVG